MKIAYCIRADYKIRGGGDAIQMLMTKKYVEKYFPHYDIHIITKLDQLKKDFNICHVFNYSTVNETEGYINKAKELKIKIATSPIYWDYSITAYYYFSKLGFFRISETVLKFEIKLLKVIQKFYPIFMFTSKKFRKQCVHFLDSSDVILPNSVEEYELLLRFINQPNLNHYNYKVVYNATEIKNIERNEGFLKKYSLPKNFLLQVGRIEPIKNQMNVVKALVDDSTIPIVFLGKIFDENYYNELRKISEKRGNVFFIEEVPYEDVFDFYFYAHTHILPSLRESPGLVSLEAYSQGCNIICSKFPYSPFDTYFKNIGISIDPLSLDSIRKGIRESFARGRTEKQLMDLEIFSWDNTAKSTNEAYQKLYSQ